MTGALPRLGVGAVIGLLEQLLEYPPAISAANATANHYCVRAIMLAQTQRRGKGFNKVRARVQSSYTTDMSSAPVAPAWFRYVSWSFGLVLLLGVALQWQSVTPLRWIAMYTGAAAISIILPLRLRLHSIAVVIGMVAAIWCGYLAAPVVGLVGFSDLFSTTTANAGLVDRARDAVGAALVSLWLASAATIAKRILKRATAGTAPTSVSPATTNSSHEV